MAEKRDRSDIAYLICLLIERPDTAVAFKACAMACKHGEDRYSRQGVRRIFRLCACLADAPRQAIAARQLSSESPNFKPKLRELHHKYLHDRVVFVKAQNLKQKVKSRGLLTKQRGVSESWMRSTRASGETRSVRATYGIHPSPASSIVRFQNICKTMTGS